VIVLDTNVLSELMRAEPDPHVESWIAARPASSLFVTTVTQAEILYGVALLPAGKRRDRLSLAVDGLFEQDFADRLLPFDEAAAREFADIAFSRRRRGLPISQFDAQIAAITKSRGATLATRNVADFLHCGLTVIDPWLEK
jgi:predicted nucleic acid-binding protein